MQIYESQNADYIIKKYATLSTESFGWQQKGSEYDTANHRTLPIYRLPAHSGLQTRHGSARQNHGALRPSVERRP